MLYRRGTHFFRSLQGNPHRLYPLALYIFFCVCTFLTRHLIFEPIPGLVFTFNGFLPLLAAARLGPIAGIILMSITVLISPSFGIFTGLFFIGEAIYIGFIRRWKSKSSLFEAGMIYCFIFGLPVLIGVSLFESDVSRELLILVVLTAWLNGIIDCFFAEVVDISGVLDGVPFCHNTDISLSRFFLSQISFWTVPILVAGLFFVMQMLHIKMHDELILEVKKGMRFAHAYSSIYDGEKLIDILNREELYSGSYYTGASRFLECIKPDSMEIEPNLYRIVSPSVLYTSEKERYAEYYGLANIGRNNWICFSVPVAPKINGFLRNSSFMMAAVLFFLYGLFTVGYLLTRSIVGQIDRLAHSTRNFSGYIHNGEIPSQSVILKIRELNSLSSGFHEVFRKLICLFHELRIDNSFLEKAVEKRTQELQTLTADLRNLLTRREEEIEDERRRIAQELHDEFGQDLTILGINLYQLEKRLGPDNREVAEKILEMQAVIGRLSEDMRRIVTDLRPAILDRIGLVEALRAMITEEARQCGRDITLQDSIPLELVIPDRLKTAVYRITQEGLSNAINHSGSFKILVSLSYNENLVLSIRDWGTGFDYQDYQRRENRESFGLMGIRERCTSLGGLLTIHTKPGQGTEIEAFFPMQSCPLNKSLGFPQVIKISNIRIGAS